MSSILARSLGYALCVTYALVGSAVLLVLALGGLWEGFARTTYVLFFLAMVVYVYGTAYIAYRFARAPGRPSGLLLLVLVTPAVFYFASGTGDGIDLRQEAETYARHEDPQEVEEARQKLLAHGRRAGRKDYIQVLMQYLEAANSDAQRVRLICMLGELSYQHEELLATLRELEAASRDALEREELRLAVERALLQVNPYERGQPPLPEQGRGTSADACTADGASPSSAGVRAPVPISESQE